MWNALVDLKNRLCILVTLANNVNVLIPCCFAGELAQYIEEHYCAQADFKMLCNGFFS